MSKPGPETKKILVKQEPQRDNDSDSSFSSDDEKFVCITLDENGDPFDFDEEMERKKEKYFSK